MRARNKAGIVNFHTGLVFMHKIFRKTLILYM